MRKVHSCVQYIFILILLLLSPKALLGDNIEDKIKEIEELLFFYPHKGEKELGLFLQKHKSLSVSDENKTFYLKGILAYKQSLPDTSLMYLQKALFYFNGNGDLLYQVKTQLILALTAEKVGDIKGALLLYYSIVENSDKSYKRTLGYGYMGIARCRRYLHGIQTGENYELGKGTRLLKSLGKKEYQLYADYMNCILVPTQKKHLKRLKSIAQEYINLGIYLSASSVYKSISYTYLVKNELDSSLYYADKALPLTRSLYPTRSIAPSVYHIKGIIAIKQKRYALAKKNCLYALTLSDSLHQKRILPYIYRSLVELDSVNGNLKEAKLHKQLGELYSEINNDQIKFNDLLLKVEYQKNQIERNKLQKEIMLFVIITLGLVVFICSFIIIIIRKKNKYNQEEHQRQAIRNQEQHKIQIQAMQNLMLSLGQSFNATNLEEEEIEEIFAYIPDVPTAYECFEEAYADTIIEFKNKFPTLSESHVSYAIMIYIGLPVNVIAYIKQVNLDSVRKAQRRIRERLELRRGADLFKYFHNEIKVTVEKDKIEEILTKNKEVSADSSNGMETCDTISNTNITLK